jgi:hypothetical protein
LVGSGRKSITERVETDMGTVAPTMSTMMLSQLLVLSPVNAVMGYLLPNNVPLASLVAQEEHIDVNFIRNNNFNNNAYRNNVGSNNYRPYP